MATGFNPRSVYKQLMELAVAYGVDKNALFVAAAAQYQTQQLIISKIKREIAAAKTLTTQKSYVADKENTYVHPLVKELPKHAESANRTAQTLIDIITKIGHAPEERGRLQAFNDKYDGSDT